MAVELIPYTREELGFAISFPSDSELAEDVQGAVVVAVAPPDDDGFRPNLNVVLERLDRPLDLDAYLERSLEAERRVLHGHQLLDRVPEALGGVAGVRTLAHHDVAGQAVGEYATDGLTDPPGAFNPRLELAAPVAGEMTGSDQTTGARQAA